MLEVYRIRHGEDKEGRGKFFSVVALELMDMQ